MTVEWQHREAPDDSWEDITKDEAIEYLERMDAKDLEDMFIGELRYRTVTPWEEIDG